MEKATEKNNKSICFKLFGYLAVPSEAGEIISDANRSFEIQLFPGEAPIGIVTQAERIDEKKLVVELPQEIREGGFEKICTFLLERNQDLIVKVSGHEKLGNRKLHLDPSNHTKDLLVHATIFIQWRSGPIDYQIELNPYDISCSVGQIYNHQSKEYLIAELILGELKDLKSHDLKKVLPKLKPNNFTVTVDHERMIIDLSSPLKQFIDALGKPSRYQNVKNGGKSTSYYATADEITSHCTDENLTRSDMQRHRRSAFFGPALPNLSKKDGLMSAFKRFFK